MFSLPSWLSLLKLPSDVNNVDVAPAVVMRFKVRSGVLQKTTLLGTATAQICVVLLVSRAEWEICKL